MPKPIEVSLDAAKDPPVTVNPMSQDMQRGDDTIHWIRAKNQNFDLVSVEIVDAPPGTFTSWSNSTGMISVKDHNTEAGGYTYVVTVSSGGHHFGSKKRGTHAGSGSPTIHNR